ncbi:hypothetical protein J1N35_035864 [Gossypium stocksii]|uniref:Uncharacterized protein n=1 Tax=Gossypium stocksii TaxID=47602 RepID=A0A9D3UWG9_9ROSI|nr:hypothetical protein J1N35_035864 [Gossypium stocksii]
MIEPIAEDGSLRLNCEWDDSSVLEGQDHWNVEQLEPVGKGKAMRVKDQLGTEEGNRDEVNDGDEDEGDAGDENNHEGRRKDEKDEDNGDDQVDEPVSLVVRKNPIRTRQPLSYGTHLARRRR